MLLLMKYLYLYIYETCKELCVCVCARARIYVHFWMYLCIDCMKLCIYTFVADESRKVHFHSGKCCFSVLCPAVYFCLQKVPLDSVILYLILPNCLQFSWNYIQIFVHATYLQFIFNV